MNIIKKTYIILLLIIFLMLIKTTHALTIPGNDTDILNKNINQAINTENIDNPLRDGSFMIIDNKNTRGNNEIENEVRGIINIGEIEKHSDAKESLLSFIKNIINYALGLAGLVALIYLLVHGFIILTAAGDETKYKQGIKGIKYAAIALTGIGVSFFIISLIFYIIDIIT